MPTPQLTYYQLADRVVAFSSTRKRGYSQGNYGSFNVNRYCGDNPAHIELNRQSLCQLLQVDNSRLVMPHQVHGTEIRRVDDSFFQQPVSAQTSFLEGVDALMTNSPGVCIGVSTADCIPILLYDPQHHAACAIHAGWRGTVKRITAKAVGAMKQSFGTQPSRLRAVIGPGISLQRFEVGDEVYRQFADQGFDMQQIARRYLLMATDQQQSKAAETIEKWHIDLWTCNQMQLHDEGVPCDDIQTAGICTYDHCDDYFSARRLGVDSGRILTAILLQQK